MQGGRNRGAKAVLVSALLLGGIILLSRQWWAPPAGNPGKSQISTDKTLPPVAGGDSGSFGNETGISAAPHSPEMVAVQKPDEAQERTDESPKSILKDTVKKRRGPPPMLSSGSAMSERQIKGVTFQGSAPEHGELLRKAWRAGNGKFYDSKLLHQSIEQLNQLGLYEPVSENDCEVIMRPDGHIQILVRLRQLGRGNP